jgi:hypothetical protein
MHTITFYLFNDESTYTLGTYRSETFARKLATALATRADVAIAAARRAAQ